MNTVDSKQKRSLVREWLINAVLALGLFALGMHLHAAATLGFTSNLTARNLQSDGTTPMDTTYSFQLGAFTDGFVPTAMNTDQWLANWQPATLIDDMDQPVPGNAVAYTHTEIISGSGLYTDNFSGRAKFESNAEPFEITAQGYIWGYTERVGGGTGEWILMTNPGWTFPDAGSISPVDPWGVGEAGTVAVLGAVNPDNPDPNDPNAPPHMQSAAVVLVPEPGVALLVAGTLGLALLVRRRPR